MNQEILQTYLRQEETPAYIFDLDMLKSRVQMMKTILGERAEICFAMKANPFLIGPLKDTADKFEVCSPGEFHICETVGIPMERIVLSGVNKENATLPMRCILTGMQACIQSNPGSIWSFWKCVQKKKTLRFMH